MPEGRDALPFHLSRRIELNPPPHGGSCQAELAAEITHGAVSLSFNLVLDVDSVAEARHALAIYLFDVGRSLIAGAEDARAIHQITFGEIDGRSFGRCEVQFRLADHREITVPIEFEGGNTLTDAQDNLVKRIVALGEAVVESLEHDAAEAHSYFDQHGDELRSLTHNTRWLTHAYCEGALP